MPEDKRVTKTKNKVLTVTINLLQKKTFSKITITKICQQAKINRSTFYHHFQDKRDLLIKIFESLTIEDKYVNEHQLLKEPMKIFNQILKKPLFEIIAFQQKDNEFYLIYHQYFLNYHIKIFKKMPWHSRIPRELFVYSFIGLAFSFADWEMDYQKNLSEEDFNHFFHELINYPHF